MKKIIISALAVIAVTGSCFAGPKTVVSSKEFKQPVASQFFQDKELALDAFYSYNDANAGYFADGSGGGVGLNYFVARYFGVGVEGNFWNGSRPENNKELVSQATANLIVRYPMEFAKFGVAPYVFGGGGLAYSDHKNGFSDVGAGAELRITPRVGIFADWRWNFMADKNDVNTTRAGVRFVF